MKSTLAILLASVPFLFPAFLAGCDRGGTAPDGTGTLGTGGTGNTGGTGGNGGSGGTTGGTKIDTTSSGLPIFDSVQLLGPQTLVGGTSREVLFYLAQDLSLHIIASSDGQTTIGRETVWDIQIESTDSISPLLISHEVGFIDTFSYYQDLSNPSVAQNAIHFRLHSLSGAPEARVATSSEALLTVSVQAASGVDPDTAGWFPPVLPVDSVAPLVRLGKAMTVAGTTKFAIRMPGGGSN